VNIGAGDPGVVYFKLKARLSGDEVRGQMQCKAKRREQDQEREPLDHLSRTWQQGHHDRASGGKEGDGG
jgi:regulator of replication initiation timing